MKKLNKPNYYIRPVIGRGPEVISELAKHGGKNLNCYRGEGDSSIIYYIGKDNVIQLTNESEEVGYILANGGGTELKLKTPKKEHFFLISVKEGNNHCKKCHMNSQCNDKQERNCELAELLQSEKTFNGKSLKVTELSPDDIPYEIRMCLEK